MNSRKEEMEKISKLYKKYLNGPLGRGVLQRLKEGESFSIHSQDQILHITKLDGKAVIDILSRYDSTKPKNSFST